MSLEKAIQRGREHRKPYYGAKAIDPWCRNHGECAHCRRNRQHKDKKRIEAIENRMREDANL